VPVRAVLLSLTGTFIPQVTIKQMPADVLMLDRMDVPGLFNKVPERLTPGDDREGLRRRQEEHVLAVAGQAGLDRCLTHSADSPASCWRSAWLTAAT